MDLATDDSREFEALVVRHQHVVCAIAYAVLGNRARSEEVAQDAFLVAWQRSRTAPVTPTWICGIARNLARNALRRRTEVSLSHEPPASTGDPQQLLIEQEDARRAAVALAGLSPRDREALVLYYREDHTVDGVADALGITPDAAKQRIHRGRVRLRERLTLIEAMLEATRPGPAFVVAALAAWTARGGRADATLLATAGRPAGVARFAPGLAAGLAVAVGAVAIARRAEPAPRAGRSLPATSASVCGTSHRPSARVTRSPRTPCSTPSV